MKLAAFSRNSNHYLGLVDDFNDVMKLLDIRDCSHESEGVVALIGSELPDVVEEIALTDIKLLPPTPRPRRNIFCVGRNYHDHAKEFAHSGFDSSTVKGEIPQAPIIFTKVPESVIGPGMPIRMDSTGTPADVGIGFKPLKYLVPGDIVRLEIDGIGVIENPVDRQ